MPNRRRFLKTLAGAAAGACAIGGGLAAQAPGRRQLSIAGRRVRVIDVHNHWDMPVPAEIVKGTPFEEYTKGASFDDRVPTLDKMGIDVAAVSVNDFITGLDPAIEVSPKKFYVAYKTSQNIVCMEVKQQRVLLYLKLDPKMARGQKGISRDVTDVGHYGTGDLEVSLKDASDLEATKPFIQRAYEQVGG